MTSLFFATNSYALGKVGHKVVCQVAYEHLTPSIQGKIDTLMTHLPDKHKTLINKYHHKRKNTQVNYVDTCSWADAIKRDKSFNKYKPWHYIQMPRNATEVTKNSCKKNCITNAITLHKNALKHETNKWKKLQALMFLSHWVGDIHQPMHVNFASDRGGNKIKIKYKESKCKNMHWLWDECLLYPVSKVRNQSIFFDHVYNEVSNKWKKSPVVQWQKDSVYKWATESLTIARTPSVLYCRVNKNNTCEPINKKIIKLPTSYQNTHKPMLEKRMLQASARLSQTLIEALN
jgi:hypothetical protein